MLRTWGWKQLVPGQGRQRLEPQLGRAAALGHGMMSLLFFTTTLTLQQQRSERFPGGSLAPDDQTNVFIENLLFSQDIRHPYFMPGTLLGQ